MRVHIQPPYLTGSYFSGIIPADNAGCQDKDVLPIVLQTVVAVYLRSHKTVVIDRPSLSTWEVAARNEEEQRLAVKEHV
jgi:hypothetical protein